MHAYAQLELRRLKVMDKTILTATQLMARVMRRDRSAFDVLYDQYAGAAFGLALRIVGERAASEEIVQEAFWRVWQRAPSFDARRGNFSTWLSGIVHNLAIDELRRRKRLPPRVEMDAPESPVAEIPDDAPDLVERAWARIQDAQIRGALAQLPDPQKKVLELAYFEGLTHQEIATRLNEPLGTIHTRARLGLFKLKEMLDGLL